MYGKLSLRQNARPPSGRRGKRKLLDYLAM
jgi:hypothetical protein